MTFDPSDAVPTTFQRRSKGFQWGVCSNPLYPGALEHPRWKTGPNAGVAREGMGPADRDTMLVFSTPRPASKSALGFALDGNAVRTAPPGSQILRTRSSGGC